MLQYVTAETLTRIPTLDFDWRVLAVVWMRPGRGGTSGGSLRSSRQAVA